MNKKDAKAALDAAVNDQFCRLFATLCMGLSCDPKPELVMTRFQTGCAVLRKAHKAACEILVDQSEDDKTESGH